MAISQKTITEVAYNLLARTATKYPKSFLNKLTESLKNEDRPGPKSVIVSIIISVYAVNRRFIL